MHRIVLFAILPLLVACHSGLERDVTCLGTLMPELSSALEEEEALRLHWRNAHNAAYEARLQDPGRKPWLASVSFADEVRHADEGPVNRPAGSLADLEKEAEEHYQRWAMARKHLAELRTRYEMVQRRAETRMDEQHMRWNLFGALFPSTGLLLYPLMTWNIHYVLWDGADPDAPTDPVTHFCTQRLASMPHE